MRPDRSFSVARGGLVALAVLLFFSAETVEQDARLVASDTPVLLAPGVVSTTQGEYSPTLDHRRGELYFMRRTPGQFDYTIYVSRLEAGRWSAAEMAPFSGAFRDAAPYLDPSGHQLFYDSRRPAEGLDAGSINLWRVTRQGAGWSAPELLRAPSENPPPVDGVGADEFGPAVDGAGTLYFYSFRPPFRAGARYTARGEAYEAVTLERGLADPSAPTFVSYLYLSPDGRTALMGGRADGRRDGDLFYACRQPEGAWSEARPLPGVNTTAGEQGPWLTADGRLLLFSSTRPTGNPASASSNLYLMSTETLPVPCPE